MGSEASQELWLVAAARDGEESCSQNGSQVGRQRLASQMSMPPGSSNKESMDMTRSKAREGNGNGQDEHRGRGWWR